MDHADGIVERVIVDDQPRMRLGGKDLQEVAQCDAFLDRDDVGARHHHIRHPPLAQAEDVAQHGAFFGREAGSDGALLQGGPQVGAD